jgi:hypothetical protein
MSIPDSDFPIFGQIGNRGFPDSRTSTEFKLNLAESGIRESLPDSRRESPIPGGSPRFPAKSGMGGSSRGTGIGDFRVCPVHPPTSSTLSSFGPHSAVPLAGASHCAASASSMLPVASARRSRLGLGLEPWAGVCICHSLLKPGRRPADGAGSGSIPDSGAQMGNGDGDGTGVSAPCQCTIKAPSPTPSRAGHH